MNNLLLELLEEEANREYTEKSLKRRETAVRQIENFSFLTPYGDDCVMVTTNGGYCNSSSNNIYNR